MSFLILFVFSACVAEEEEWECGWLGIWPLAGANSPHCLSPDFSQGTGSLNNFTNPHNGSDSTTLCIQEKTQDCAEPCWFQCTCVQAHLLCGEDLVGASEAPPEHKVPPVSRQLLDHDNASLKWTWSQYNCQRHMNQNKKSSSQLAHNHLAIWSSKY